MNSKQVIRQKLLQQRRQMSQDDIYRKSVIISEKLQYDIWFQSAKTILFYVSYGNEVSTHQLIKTWLQNHKYAIVPRSQIDTCSIDPKIITDWKDLQKGAYGILEPSSDAPSFTSDFDLIIIPGVGFDARGNRLGQGKGYYDRLIKDHPRARLLGLAFDFQIIDAIPTDLHDKPVQRIITEKQLITCEK